MFGEPFPCALGCNLFGVGEHIVEAPPLFHQLRGAFHADPLYTRDVVTRVSNERAQIEHLLWGDAELLLHFGRAKPTILDAVYKLDAVGAQLHQVLVCRNDRNGDVVGGMRGERCDHVIGFEARDLDALNSMRVDQFFNQRELHAQVFGRRVAIRFVFFVDLVAKRTAFGIHRNCDVVGRFFPNDLVQDVGKSKNGIRWRTVWPAQPGDPEERAKDRVGSIDHNEALQSLLTLALFTRCRALPFFRHGAPRCRWGSVSRALLSRARLARIYRSQEQRAICRVRPCRTKPNRSG